MSAASVALGLEHALKGERAARLARCGSVELQMDAVIAGLSLLKMRVARAHYPRPAL